MSSAALDQLRLSEALTLAEQSVGLSDPNPRVGCVIGHADGRVLGRGHTQQAGGAHAEVAALRDAEASGALAHGATAWVTLEPCAHHGRTPPCCDALIRAGVRRVVIALTDPYPAVAGEGVRRLRATGIDVDFAPPDIAERAWALNLGFFSRVLRGRPWVRVKIASSLDGRTALDNGASQWITGTESRSDGHAWRRRAGAVLTGIGTVLADDPRLDVRLVPTVLQPVRVVADSQLRIPLTARLLDAPGTVWLATSQPMGARADALRRRGAELIGLPGGNGQVDLAALLALMAERGVNELHVEAGETLAGTMLRAGLVDEVLAYVAPLLLGGGRGWVNWPDLAHLDQGLRLNLLDVQALGSDLRLRLTTTQGASFGVAWREHSASICFTSAATSK